MEQVPAAPRRLNYGCGYDKRPGYLNVDIDPACRPDVLLDGGDLVSLGRESFVEVLARDVLEHVPRLETSALLLDFADLLVDGGALRLQTSSVEGVAKQLKRHRDFRQHYNWIHCLFGTQAQHGDFHLTGFTKLSLSVYLLAAGFDIDRMWITDHWLLNAEATKVSSWSRLADQELGDAEFVRAMCREALYREPGPYDLALFRARAASGKLTRRDLLKQVYASPERLFAVAERHGFARRSSPLSAQRVVQHIPESWKPTLRSMRRVTRDASIRGRRALGAMRSRPSHT
jgi:hypothetical protein